MNITPEARDAADNECNEYELRLCEGPVGRQQKGHFVQLAINAAVAEKDTEIERLTKGYTICSQELENVTKQLAELRDKFDSDGKLLMRTAKRLAELREIADGLADISQNVHDSTIFHDVLGNYRINLTRYTQWKEKNEK